MNKQKTRQWRLLSMGGITLLVFAGGIAGIGTGTLSSYGWKIFYSICPLGYLETALASRDIMFRLLLCFLVIGGLTILLGRVFCGWICPVPLVRKLFTNKIDDKNDIFLTNRKRNQENDVKRGVTLDGVERKHLEDKETRKACASLESSTSEKKQNSLGLPILGASLASSAIFGFPVFCLICPIGLIFGTLFALMHLLRFNEPTIDLVVFPIVIVVELILLKKWCSRFCPLGALLSLFSRFNRRLVPTVDRTRCLEDTQGTHCHQCRKACSLDIDLKNSTGTGHISSCIKCKECATSCPVHAISFPWKKAAKSDTLQKKEERL